MSVFKPPQAPYSLHSTAQPLTLGGDGNSEAAAQQKHHINTSPPPPPMRCAHLQIHRGSFSSQYLLLASRTHRSETQTQI